MRRAPVLPPCGSQTRPYRLATGKGPESGNFLWHLYGMCAAGFERWRDMEVAFELRGWGGFEQGFWVVRACGREEGAFSRSSGGFETRAYRLVWGKGQAEGAFSRSARELETRAYRLVWERGQAEKGLPAVAVQQKSFAAVVCSIARRVRSFKHQVDFTCNTCSSSTIRDNEPSGHDDEDGGESVSYSGAGLRAGGRRTAGSSDALAAAVSTHAGPADGDAASDA